LEAIEVIEELQLKISLSPPLSKGEEKGDLKEKELDWMI
jgi:hypothetical protein